MTFIFKEGRVSVYDFKVAMAGTEKCKMFNIFIKIFSEMSLKWNTKNLNKCYVLKILYESLMMIKFFLKKGLKVA